MGEKTEIQEEIQGEIKELKGSFIELKDSVDEFKNQMTINSVMGEKIAGVMYDVSVEKNRNIVQDKEINDNNKDIKSVRKDVTELMLNHREIKNDIGNTKDDIREIKEGMINYKEEYVTNMKEIKKSNGKAKVVLFGYLSVFTPLIVILFMAIFSAVNNLTVRMGTVKNEVIAIKDDVIEEYRKTNECLMKAYGIDTTKHVKRKKKQ